MRRLLGLLLTLCLGTAVAAPVAEYNPVRSDPISVGPEMSRVIVGFRATPNNSVTQTITVRSRAQHVVQAQTTGADVSSLVQRIGISMAKSRQITPSMHVIVLKQTLYGADVETALATLRADPAVEYVAVDQKRYIETMPNDPLFIASSGASGQWYMQTPPTASTCVPNGTTPLCDVAATDAVSAWALSTGNAGVVIADVDTGVRFDHPDLLRAGLGVGGRLLPGYDFVSQDEAPNTGSLLGTYLVANDGDGWDPDPSDPGDWVSTADQATSLFASCTVQPSSWHGTRVMGILGAITNNGVGIAGMTWGSWILPVRALGKCSGYDSDIIAGIEWAAGMSVSTAATPVPNNPYPADIINLSLGGSGSCSPAFEMALKAVTNLGALVVVSAGNSSTAVGSPANCSTLVPGVIAVAGLRNVGTKVGYSSFGPEVGISAPAGNCINTSGACLRSIDTTTNLGATTPGQNSYTNQTDSNLGTSFSAPIVSGIAGLMRSINANLTPAQLVTRLQKGAAPFPSNPDTTYVCGVNSDPTTGECSCLGTSQCGAGMANALGAVNAALAPIAAVSFPSSYTANTSVVFDGSGSAASCNRTIASYAWTASGALTIVSGASSKQATVMGAGTLTLTVTDSLGASDIATITVGATSATTTAPTSAGSNACLTAVAINPRAPTITEAFAPTTVGPTVTSMLTVTLNNTNGFALTQSDFIETLPSSLSVSGTGSTTCTGATASLQAAGSSVALTGAIIPANGSCTVTLPVSSSTGGTYTNTIPANALTTGPAGGNTATATASVTVTAPVAPTISVAFAPSSVSTNSQSTLTITLSNSNAYALTKAALTDTLPSGVTVATSSTPANTCNGSLTAGSGTETLASATIPASGSCTITLSVSSSATGTYTDTIGASSLTTAQNASNTAGASGTLTVTAPSHGGGALDWLDLAFVGGVLALSRRRVAHR
jgi:serine protease